MKIGIIGAGMIGGKRALSATESGDRIVKVADTNLERAKALSLSYPGSVATSSWKEVVSDKRIEAVVVSTTHNNLAKISYEALKAGKHVLSEKPLGINVKEVGKCVALARKKKLIYKGGYNHRFHPGISKAKEFFDRGAIGKIIYINGIYGHGGRPGYEKEWRMQKKISGGGELIDQGAHLIDLSLWFYGKMPKQIFGAVSTAFWKINVEDNAFVILKDGNFVANLHAGWTEWKNRFVFEIYGQKGYLKVNGLGGSYGNETLTQGVRIPGKAPKEKLWTFENKDVSWKKEWQNFKLAINRKAKINGTGSEGLEVLKVIEKIYNTQI